MYGDYNQVTIIYQREQSFAPSIVGVVDSYSITPELPANLTLDPQTGVISGVLQSEISGLEFNVTATNSVGSVTETISLTSIIVNCEATEDYLATAHGEYSVAVCPLYYTGYALARCMGGVFEEPSLEHCSPRLSSFFTFSITSISAKTGSSITPISFLTDGPFSSLSISPELPSGLTFVDGVISGTPTEARVATEYTVTGENDAETKTATITITVDDNSCPALDEFEAVGNGETSSASVCPEGYSALLLESVLMVSSSLLTTVVVLWWLLPVLVTLPAA